MKKFPAIVLAASATLALAACGSSESAKEEATPDNVEMPAEEAMTDVDAAPAADPNATATGDATAAASDAATGAASEAAPAEQGEGKSSPPKI